MAFFFDVLKRIKFSDLSTIGEVVKRFQNCFGIRDVCIVSDRGMISDEMLKFLGAPECSFSYILGVRMRKVKEGWSEVLADAGKYQEIKRTNPRHEPLKVKEVKLGGRRYVVCLNEKQARKDAHDRQLIVESLLEKLKSGDKSLIRNCGYRKFLKTKDRNNFQID